MLSAALNMAARWRLNEHNVCEEVTPPKVQQPEIRPSRLEKAKQFIAAASDYRCEALFISGLTSAARWGELTGFFGSEPRP